MDLNDEIIMDGSDKIINGLIDLLILNGILSNINGLMLGNSGLLLDNLSNGLS